jgi:catechol 2,3-dioxygenase-like lactoylglutathione lyase family enzyme
VPRFKGINYVGLSVRNVRLSAAWYSDVLGLETIHENIQGSKWPSDWDEVLLKDPHSGLLIGLLGPTRRFMWPG